MILVKRRSAPGEFDFDVLRIRTSSLEWVGTAPQPSDAEGGYQKYQ